MCRRDSNDRRRYSRIIRCRRWRRVHSWRPSLRRLARRRSRPTIRADSVRIQSLAGERWALVSVAPGQLWPQVRTFPDDQWHRGGGGRCRGGTDRHAMVQTRRSRSSRCASSFRVDTGVQRNTRRSCTSSSRTGVWRRFQLAATNRMIAELERQNASRTCRAVSGQQRGRHTDIDDGRSRDERLRHALRWRTRRPATRIRLELRFRSRMGISGEGNRGRRLCTIDDRDRSRGHSSMSPLSGHRKRKTAAGSTGCGVARKTIHWRATGTKFDLDRAQRVIR